MSRRNTVKSRHFWKHYLTYAALFVLLNAVLAGWVYWRAQLLLADDTLRMTIPPQTIQAFVEDLRWLVAILAVVGLGSAIAIGYVIARRITLPIAEMVDVCEALRAGNYDRRVKVVGKDELAVLGDTLNRLGDEVTRQINTLSLERAQLKTMLAGMFEGIIAIDNDDRIQFCNRAAYRLLNCKISDVRRMRLEEVTGFDIIEPLVAEARRRNELVADELTLGENLDQRHIEYHASVYQGKYQGKESSGVIVVLHDVSKIRHLERIRRDFFANVSHEIKTPLTAIKGYVETLLSGALEDKEVARRFLEKVFRNATRLQSLVQDILSLSHVESHEDGLELQPSNWQLVVNQVLGQYEDEFARKHLRVSIEQPSEPVVVLGEKNAMFQVLDNLVTNAIRYTPDSGQIAIRLHQDGTRGVLSVADTGIGIPQKYQERIFERFYRVDKARSRELGGTGLGLAIVKHLVVGMNGSIGVSSQVGKGSTFKVSLSLAH